MNSAASFFIGWDVGGWNCDKNSKSRDAIVILDRERDIVGTPWRGNLRETINGAADTAGWIGALFTLCQAAPPSDAEAVLLAIDTPLGFSNEFLDLAAKLKPVPLLGKSDSNPYLFRRTERLLFERGLSPLSAIKDMIGSQATKGMHVLARFAPTMERCGQWTDGNQLRVIEAYPSACKNSARLAGLVRRYEPLDHDDNQDALICALIAWLFSEHRDDLIGPDENIPASEGWIWVPRDAIPDKRP